MTNKEALTALTEIFIVSCMSAPTREKAETYNIALQIAHKALEKQTPKKPRKYQGVTLECPTCGSVKTHSAPYCKYCGQALDWSGDE